MEDKTKQLYELIEQWTRAEIIARHVPFCNKEFANYAQIQIEKEDEIRQLVFGTDNLIVLGIKWGLLKTVEELAEEKKKQTKAEKQAQYKQLQKELAALLKE